MIRYGKTTQTAVAAMSRLAEVYDQGQALSSQQIAENRALAQPLVAKLLTTLAQAGLVTGVRGPGGGYSLARPPASISLHEITVVFERREDTIVCPFGPQWCGRQDPCPLHDDYVRFVEQFDEYLRQTRLDVFCRPRGAATRKNTKTLSSRQQRKMPRQTKSTSTPLRSG